MDLVDSAMEFCDFGWIYIALSSNNGILLGEIVTRRIAPRYGKHKLGHLQLKPLQRYQIVWILNPDRNSDVSPSRIRNSSVHRSSNRALPASVPSINDNVGTGSVGTRVADQINIRAL